MTLISDNTKTFYIALNILLKNSPNRFPIRKKEPGYMSRSPNACVAIKARI